MSAHLNTIIEKQHGSATASVVFLDVIKYSKRKSIIQQKVIQSFNGILLKAIESISAKHITESQKQGLNLATDIVRIPTGDGAAIIFPFQGLQNIHLDFALDFLSHSLASRRDIECSIFNINGWCNCHDFLDVRIGIADGKVIIFKDINGNYNVAGNTVNVASRVMALGDRQHIIFSMEAYKNIIDMTEDTALEDRFAIHGRFKVKHDLEIQICQYVGHGENFVNKEIPLDIQIFLKEKSLKSAHPMFQNQDPKSPIDRLQNLEAMEILKDLPIPEGMAGFLSPANGLMDKEKLKTFVEAFVSIDKLMRQGITGKIIDSDVNKRTENG